MHLCEQKYWKLSKCSCCNKFNTTLRKRIKWRDLLCRRQMGQFHQVSRQNGILCQTSLVRQQRHHVGRGKQQQCVLSKLIKKNKNTNCCVVVFTPNHNWYSDMTFIRLDIVFVHSLFMFISQTRCSYAHFSCLSPQHDVHTLVFHVYPFEHRVHTLVFHVCPPNTMFIHSFFMFIPQTRCSYTHFSCLSPKHDVHTLVFHVYPFEHRVHTLVFHVYPPNTMFVHSLIMFILLDLVFIHSIYMFILLDLVFIHSFFMFILLNIVFIHSFFMFILLNIVFIHSYFKFIPPNTMFVNSFFMFSF